MKYFKEEKVKIHEEIVIQGQPSDYLIIIKQGDFEMIKRVQYTVGYYDIQSIKDQEIVLLLTSGSIVGEDGYLYDKVNSYTVKSSWENGVIYKINTKKFESFMVEFKKDFKKLLK